MSRISSAALIKDGEKIEGFTKFKEGKIEVSQVVEQADGFDVVDIPRQYGFSVTISPEKGADREWLDIDGATFIVQYTGGNKVVYDGVKCLSMDFSETDGKAQKEYILEFFAKSRKVS